MSSLVLQSGKGCTRTLELDGVWELYHVASWHFSTKRNARVRLLQVASHLQLFAIRKLKGLLKGRNDGLLTHYCMSTCPSINTAGDTGSCADTAYGDRTSMTTSTMKSVCRFLQEAVSKKIAGASWQIIVQRIT